MTSADSTFAGVAQKADAEQAGIDQEDKELAALEADLKAAEARVESAESKFALAKRRQAEELSKPLLDDDTKPNVVLGEGRNETDNGVSAVPDHTLKGSTDTKNNSARTDKEVSRDKWLADRNAEGRVRDNAKKLRERLRRGARGKRMEFDGHFAGEEAATPKAEQAKPAVTKPKGTPDPLFESDEVKAGAKGLAERLVAVKDVPNAANKKDAALRILTGGRESYYTSEPANILQDLKERGLVEASLASELASLLTTEPEKGAGVAKEEWLSHAQKVSSVERKDEQPFKQAETLFLKWFDNKAFLNAEAELDAAELELQKLIDQADAAYPLDAGAEAQEEEKRKASAPADKKDDVDYYANKAEDAFDAGKESRGGKNTSALSEKVVSSQKWMQERGTENRDREKEVIAREARRGEARDRKAGSAEVDE